MAYIAISFILWTNSQHIQDFAYYTYIKSKIHNAFKACLLILILRENSNQIESINYNVLFFIIDIIVHQAPKKPYFLYSFPFCKIQNCTLISKIAPPKKAIFEAENQKLVLFSHEQMP